MASWKENVKNQKHWFLNFSFGQIEISIQIECSGRRLNDFVLESKTISIVLSNAHSTIFSRNVQQAELGFKEAHENGKFQKSIFGPDEIQKKS